MSLRAVIFDMDGVICDSEPLHMQAFQRVMQEESVFIPDQMYYDRYLAHDDRGSFEAAFADHARPAADAETMRQMLIRKARYFDELMKDRLVIYPGAESLVRRLGEKFALALASGARRLEVEYVLKKAKIRDQFAAVVSADDVKEGKPRPEAFMRALTLLNQTRLDGTPLLQAPEVLVIEDSPRCVRTAKALGMKTLGVATSYAPEHLKEADRIVTSLIGVEIAELEALFG